LLQIDDGRGFSKVENVTDRGKKSKVISVTGLGGL
jgi:hypothetical protein